MAGWTISRSDGDTVEVYFTDGAVRTFMGGMTDAGLNGVFATKLEALEAALEGAVEELQVARSRVRKLRAKIRRERARAPREE